MSQTGSYDVVVGAIATVMRVVREPNEGLAGEYSFSGFLETTAVPAVGIGGETVDLVVDGAVVDSRITGADGSWGFDFYIEPGATYAVKAAFAGTAEYEASETPTYSLTPTKIPTTMTVTTAPPATADAGVPFPFDGALVEAGAVPTAIEGATVNLYVGGSLAGSTVTGAGGVWGFSVTMDTPGTVAIYAEFPGDARYLGCSEKISIARWLAPAGLLTMAGLVGIAWLGR